MNAVEIDAINTERLDRWRVKLTAAHATPMLLLGVGHDHRNGEVNIIVPESLSTNDAKKMLRGILRRMP